jgi:hypothetical protein
MGELNNTPTSRRDFLKKSLKTVGYSIPAMMAFSSVSLNAFASRYSRNSNHNHRPGHHNHRPGHHNHRPGHHN